MREVKTQAVVGIQRAFLVNMVTQHFTQSSVQQVGCRMVQRRRLTFFCIDSRCQLVANFHTALDQNTFVQMVTGFFGSVFHLEDHAVGFKETGITSLTTAFRIESGFVQYQYGFITGVQLINRFTVFEQGFYRTGIFQLFVAKEVGFTVQRQAFTIIAIKVAGRTGHLALALHGRIKACFVHFQIPLTGHVSGEVQRETEGIVQFEGSFTRNGVAGHFSNGFIQNAHAFIQRFGELLFFQTQHFHHVILQVHQLRIGVAHLFAQCRYQLVEETGRCAQHMTMTYRTTDNTTQHVTTAFVGWQHAVHDQEAG